MRLVFIRGLPGTGKTTIAVALARRLGAEHLWIDGYKLQARTDSIEDDCCYAYRRAVAELERLIDVGRDVVVEELFCDEGLLEQVDQILRSHQAPRVWWFRLERPLEDLLSVERDREGIRKTRNTREEFIEMAKTLEETQRPDEVVITNRNLPEALKTILDLVAD